MICFIYRSKVKAEMYLYTLVKDDFSSVPEPQIKAFGKPEFSMMINLQKRQKLARVDIELVSKALTEDKYYLQMPPTVLHDQNFLNQ